VKINYLTNDGTEVFASTASMALMHWHMRNAPIAVSSGPGVRISIGNPIPGPYDELFLVNVIADIERNFGTAPQIARELFDKGWYTVLPNINDHRDISRLVDNEHVVFYEMECLKLLHWLKLNGDIAFLSVEE